MATSELLDDRSAAGGGKQMVLDAELVAVDRNDGNKLRSFQEMSTRARGQTEIHQVPPPPFHTHQKLQLFPGLSTRTGPDASPLPHFQEAQVSLPRAVRSLTVHPFWPLIMEVE